MASSFEKSVKGATKIKAAPPKSKYIEHILVATHSGEAGVGEVFRALQYRLRDSTWTVVFKSLITTHLMIREGSPDATLAYLAKHKNLLAISSFSDAQTQGRNIRHYANYLSERARAYRETKIDWVRSQQPRLEKLTVDKGLLRETEVVQHQLTALLKCDVMENEPENEITITVFRLLVSDLLVLFQVLNQAMINILGHFFEMSKVDAERAMEIYRAFAKQTDYVVHYLAVARQYEPHTRVEVPKLKHAPTNLGRQLEEYLRDPDFEVHRRQYIAEQSAKGGKGGGAGFKTATNSESSTKPAPASNNPFPPTNGSSSASKPAASKGPDPDLIDFFDSIEQNQTPMQVNPQPTAGIQYATDTSFQTQPTGFQPGFAAQQTGYVANPGFQQPNLGPFAQQQQPQQLQPNFTGAGFGGYTPQPSFQPSSLAPIPQNTVASFQPTTMQGGITGQPAPTPMLPMQTGQSTNPFRQSMLMTQGTGMPQLQQQQQSGGVVSPTSPLQRQSTNPFARSSPQGVTPFAPAAANATGGSPFQAQAPSPSQLGPPAAAPLQPMATGTNPFAKNFGGSTAAALAPRPATAGAGANSSAAPLVAQPTGSTNPFRQGPFVNHATGLGWQHNASSVGGLDQGTIEVFPRPAAQTPWQQ